MPVNLCEFLWYTCEPVCVLVICLWTCVFLWYACEPVCVLVICLWTCVCSCDMPVKLFMFLWHICKAVCVLVICLWTCVCSCDMPFNLCVFLWHICEPVCFCDMPVNLCMFFYMLVNLCVLVICFWTCMCSCDTHVTRPCAFLWFVLWSPVYPFFWCLNGSAIPFRLYFHTNVCRLIVISPETSSSTFSTDILGTFLSSNFHFWIYLISCNVVS